MIGAAGVVRSARGRLLDRSFGSVCRRGIAAPPGAAVDATSIVASFHGSRLRPRRRRRRSACSWRQGSCGPSPRLRRRIAAGRCRRATAPAAPLTGLDPERSAQDGRLSPSAGSRRRGSPSSTAAAGRSLAARGSVAKRPCHRRCLVGGIRLSRLRQVRRVEIVFARDADQREQGIASRVGERRSHPARRRGLADRAHWPFRRQPLS